MKINNIILDVDGTLTNGKVTFNDLGNEFKSFCVKDGMAISYLINENINIYVITGRKSKINDIRFKELGVKNLYQGIKNKDKLLDDLKINLSETLYIGDDINDYKAMKKCAIKGCPKDAVKEIKNISNYISENNGGEGAVRDIIDNYFDIKHREDSQQ